MPTSLFHFERRGLTVDIDADAFEGMVRGHVRPMDDGPVSEQLFSAAAQIARAAPFDFSKLIRLDASQNGLVLAFASVALSVVTDFRCGLVDDFYFAQCYEISGYKCINVETGLGIAMSSTFPGSIYVNNENFALLFADIQHFLIELYSSEEALEDIRSIDDKTLRDALTHFSDFVNMPRPY